MTRGYVGQGNRQNRILRYKYRSIRYHFLVRKAKEKRYSEPNPKTKTSMIFLFLIKIPKNTEY